MHAIMGPKVVVPVCDDGPEYRNAMRGIDTLHCMICGYTAVVRIVFRYFVGFTYKHTYISVYVSKELM